MKIKSFILMLFFIGLPFQIQADMIKRSTQLPSFFVPDNAFNTSQKSTLTSSKKNFGNTYSIAAKIKYPAAPIKEIATKNFLSNEYTQKITKSYTFTPIQLQKLLDGEYDNINKDTLYMRQILTGLRQKTRGYLFANFKITEQINQEIYQSRKLIKNVKKRYTDLFSSLNDTDKIYLIESYSPELLFRSYHEQHADDNLRQLRLSGHLNDISCISVFNSDKKHLFTYTRKHTDMLKNRKINAKQFSDTNAKLIYQTLFDNYLLDLKRIGYGLDVRNQILIRQLNEMQDIVMKLP